MRKNNELSTEQLLEEGEAYRRLAGLEAPRVERFDVIVIGGGQAGLSVGHHLAKQGANFLILDGGERIGDSWRKRWDSLRLFSPARFNGLDGMPFPGDPEAFPTKDQMADYLEAYAAQFRLPVRLGVKVERLSRTGATYRIEAGSKVFEAKHVVVAMASYQGRKVPAFASELSKDIVQLHSSEYKNLAQLRPGKVLLAGAGNSGAEIAMETVTQHPTLLSGRDPGEVPFKHGGRLARWGVLRFLFRVVFHRILTVDNPLGRKARPKLIKGGNPRIRQKLRNLKAAGVERVAKTTGVKDGKPTLADGSTIDVANIIWCNGFDLGLSWIELPIFDEQGEPIHKSGLVESEPGLYFVGQHFLHSMSSSMIHGVGRDAARIAAAVRGRSGVVSGESRRLPEGKSKEVRV